MWKERLRNPGDHEKTTPKTPKEWPRFGWKYRFSWTRATPSEFTGWIGYRSGLGSWCNIKTRASGFNPGMDATGQFRVGGVICRFSRFRKPTNDQI